MSVYKKQETVSFSQEALKLKKKIKPLSLSKRFKTLILMKKNKQEQHPASARQTGIASS